MYGDYARHHCVLAAAKTQARPINSLSLLDVTGWSSSSTGRGNCSCLQALLHTPLLYTFSCHYGAA